MSVVNDLQPTARDWRPWLLAGLGVLVVGLLDQSAVLRFNALSAGWSILAVLGMAAAVAVARFRPGIALALIWVVGLVHVLGQTGVIFSDMGIMVVAFGCARWGDRATLWLSGISIPVGGLIAGFATSFAIEYALNRFVDLTPAIGLIRALGPVARLLLAFVPVAFLVVPWLIGLVLRSSDRAEASRQQQTLAESGRAVAESDRAAAESERALAEEARWQAQEIADLRADQARMAHDVHDVVGHSLAVILAQAESAQFLPEGDTDRIRLTMANIATSARQSLRDVRDVLATGAPTTGGAATVGMESLVDGVRAAGHDVRSTVVGTPQPLPPELNAVAYRVLQEMLTNALKHGRRDTPVLVERHWEGELRIETRNDARVETGPGSDVTQVVRADGATEVIPTPAAGDPTATRTGLGIPGMRARVESVGGRLDVRRREGEGGPTFTVTAWMPLRPTMTETR